MIILQAVVLPVTLSTCQLINVDFMPTLVNTPTLIFFKFNIKDQRQLSAS